MKKQKIIILAIHIIFLLNSCINIFDEDNEYVSVSITNNTDESVIIYGGLQFVFDVPSTIIPSGDSQEVTVIKGEKVYATGYNSKKSYGHRTFYMYSKWYIYKWDIC